MTWEEIARMAVRATGSRAHVDVVPARAFGGPAFLADAWQLDDARLRAALGWSPRRGAAEVREALAAAVARTWRREE